MKRILSMIRKEFLQIRRDPRMLPILFIAPIVQLLLLGYAVDLDVRNVPVVACDLDRSRESRIFLEGLLNTGEFVLRTRVEDIRDIDRFLDRGEASLALVLPKGFGSKISGGRQTELLIIADGSESQSGAIALNHATLYAHRFSRKVLRERRERLGVDLKVVPVGINPEIRVWYNPELRSRYFLVPGVLGLVLLVMTMMLTSMAVVREKEMGTMEQLIVTPLSPGQLILGKLLPFLVIGIIDVGIVLAVARWGLGVPFRGSVPLLFVLSLIFMFSTLGLGLFISTFSRNQQQAMLTAVFFMIPMFLLSGFVFPIENMPGFFQILTRLIPIRYFFVTVRGILLKGVGISVLWDEALVLLVFGIVILVMSSLRFRKKLE